jgi:hypothetical protein
MGPPSRRVAEAMRLITEWYDFYGLQSVGFVVLGGDPAAAGQQEQCKDNLNLDTDGDPSFAARTPSRARLGDMVHPLQNGTNPKPSTPNL